MKVKSPLIKTHLKSALVDTRAAASVLQRLRAKTNTPFKPVQPPKTVSHTGPNTPARDLKKQENTTVQRVVVAAVVKKPGLVQRHLAPTFSRVVQATKFYPNLHPGAIEQVDMSNLFRLNSFADQYRLHKVHSHGVNVPNQQYNFVRTREGEMLLHARYRHPSIAEGKHVLYAGEIFFNNGQLEWWSNGSGHYQPSADDAAQANLPMDQFFSYQQIIKGEHKRKRS